MIHDTSDFNIVKIKINSITQLKEVVKNNWWYNKVLKYSNNKNCPDVEAAKQLEDLFMQYAIHFDNSATIVKATASGYYLDVNFSYATNNDIKWTKVCLYLSDDYCQPNYEPTMSYSVVDSFISGYTVNQQLSEKEVKFVKNIEWIETMLATDGRADFNKLCDILSEHNLITMIMHAAENGKLVQLGMDKELFWNVSGKNNRTLFRKGIGYNLPTLRDSARQTFEVKYNKTLEAAIADSNSADNILLYNNGKLSRYMKVKAKTYILFGPAIEFKINEYTEIRNILPATWKEFWENIN